ncbi:MAG: hypothetical protein JO025_27150 [Verrucomicrobia bacterium]|nr:hypothetical protein [Verrucomicrobiota bacterium]
MSLETYAMMGAGIASLVVGLLFVRARFRTASGADRVLVFGPVFEAVALAVFAAEHFTAAQDLMGIVPPWLPSPLFWTYFVGAAWLAAAISFIIWRLVHWSAPLVALMFLTIVVTIDLPSLPSHMGERLLWTLTVRELAFGGGAMVLAGSVWPRQSFASSALISVGRVIVGGTLIFYGIQHFLFPLFAPGIPLEKLTPPWVLFPLPLAYIIGLIQVLTGIGLFILPTIRISAATAGITVLLLTVFLYVPILVLEFNTDLAVEGLNYVFDTLLFAATALLAGFGADHPRRT